MNRRSQQETSSTPGWEWSVPASPSYLVQERIRTAVAKAPGAYSCEFFIQAHSLLSSGQSVPITRVSKTFKIQIVHLEPHNPLKRQSMFNGNLSVFNSYIPKPLCKSNQHNERLTPNNIKPKRWHRHRQTFLTYFKFDLGIRTGIALLPHYSDECLS